MDFRKIFDDNKSIAVIGMSKNSSKAAHNVPAFLIGQGYEVFPINPTADEIAGRTAYKDLMDVPGKIDILNVFRPGEEALKIVEKAIKRKHEKGDIRLIWLQEGITNDRARDLAIANGFEFIQDKCMYKEFMRK
jgi:hypothetical protein